MKGQYHLILILTIFTFVFEELYDFVC